MCGKRRVPHRTKLEKSRERENTWRQQLTRRKEESSCCCFFPFSHTKTLPFPSSSLMLLNILSSPPSSESNARTTEEKRREREREGEKGTLRLPRKKAPSLPSPSREPPPPPPLMQLCFLPTERRELSLGSLQYHRCCIARGALLLGRRGKRRRRRPPSRSSKTRNKIHQLRTCKKPLNTLFPSFLFHQESTVIWLYFW